jgi:hypothetical protein
MGIKELRSGHGRIANVKALKKQPPPRTPRFPTSTATLGIIFALTSSIPLEKLADELNNLNAQYELRSWTDMVVVISQGAINIVCQQPATVLANFLPPADGAPTTLPMYVHLFARGPANFSMNRMCALLFTHLQVFSPGAVLPSSAEILLGAPKAGVLIGAYQFDSKGNLAQVPFEFRFNRFLSPISYRVQDKNGNLLARVGYLQWQDGGLIRVDGKLSIDAIVPFIQPKPTGAQKFKIPTGEISSVLQMNESDFHKTVKAFSAASDLVIKPDEHKFVVTKISDEGSSSPFMARLMAGILTLRDQANLGEQRRANFDNAYEPLFSSLRSARKAAQSAAKLFADHSKRVREGMVARVEAGSLRVEEAIDTQLREQAESLISNLGRAFKDRIQEVMRALDVDIGLLYQSQAIFDAELALLASPEPLLASYLKESRTRWSEKLARSRIALEHESWIFPPIRYFEEYGGGVSAKEPLIEGLTISEFGTHMFDRVACFVEDLTVFGIQKYVHQGLAIAEIPLSERAPELPVRFRMALETSELKPWAIRYHENRFDDT